MKEKIDLRIVKTKKNIYEAFMSLLEEHPFEEIKVSEICAKALINRSTFYIHFQDKYSLLDSLIRDLKVGLQTVLMQNEEISSLKEYYMAIIKILLDFIEENKKFYIPIVINNRNSIARDMIYDTLEEDISNRIKRDANSKIPSEFVTYFYLGAIFNVGIEWIRNRCTYSKEEIIEYLDMLIPEDI